MLRKIRPPQLPGAVYMMPYSIFLTKNVAIQVDGADKGRWARWGHTAGVCLTRALSTAV